MIKCNQFDSDFVVGVSSSAFQTEGTHLNDGKGPSIWDVFTEKKGTIKGEQNAKIATNFYENFQQDLELMNWMNCRNFRFSVSWSRIFPQGVGKTNKKGIEFYDRLIDACLEKNINPWITLYHWDLPQMLELKGGWRNRDCLAWFEEFVFLIITLFSDRVKNWMVLNEPTAFTGLGYFMGMHAPGKKGLSNFLPAMHHAAMAQSAGGRLIKSIDAELNVGTTFSFSHLEAYRNIERDEKAKSRVDALINRMFLEPLLGLGYPFEELPVLQKVENYMKAGDEKRLAHHFDFIGVQNYSREIVKHSYFTPIVNAKIISAKKRNKRETAIGWEYFPEGIYHVLKKLQTYKKLPKLIVTESGVALHDEIGENEKVNDTQRIDYLKRSMNAVQQAKAEGVNVNGFFVWALSDNFEWAEGYSPRFGLIYIDYKTLKRIPKKSAYWLKTLLMN